MRSRDERVDEVAALLRAHFANECDPVLDELSEKATAVAMRCSRATLSRWYWEGTGPIRPVRVLGNRRWYSTRRIAEWLTDGEATAD